MEFKNIIVEQKDGIGLLKINRPNVMNALNIETVREIKSGIENLEKDEAVKVVIITGAGEKAFVAGADIAKMKEMSPRGAEVFAKEGHQCMNAIENCRKPAIAAVNGFALGGGAEIALACDFIYASDSAKFGLPEVKLGLYPGFGGTQRLSRAIGANLARELIFTGRMISAEDGLKIGLVNKVVPQNQLMDAVLNTAKEIMANGFVAIALAKHCVNTGINKSFEEGLDLERKTFSKCFETEDRLEGISAFLEKRKPAFKGR